MNLTYFDYGIVFSITIVTLLIAFGTQKYTKSVADFLAANRCAGKYLLTVAEGAAGIGVITILAHMEMYYHAGFAGTWWNWVMMPIYYTLALSGWMLYRFRETRCLTIAQFLEVRYSKRLRITAGLLSWISGMVGFAIFPGIGARFFINYCGFPECISILGVSVSVFVIIVILLVSISLLLTVVGGQIAVLVTEFFQGSISSLAFLLIAGFLLYKVSWTEIGEILSVQPAGLSKINPFDIHKVKGFNFWFFAILWFYVFYNWQPGSGTQAAKNAHAARMGKILSDARNWATTLVMVIVPIVAYVVMNHMNYAGLAGEINAVIDKTPETGSRIQILIPVFLSRILPVGLSGIFVAVMVAAFISSHATFLQVLGSVFIQDVIMPFRKKPIEAKQHLLLLRFAIIGVAVYVCTFGLFYKSSEFIFMFWAATSAIYFGGAGAVIVGGLYWKRGTTVAAFCAFFTGMTIGIAGIILTQTVENFPINGQWAGLIAGVTSVVVYVTVSLFGRQSFNLQKMLHRGEYAIKGDESFEKNIKVSNKFLRFFGITEEFSKIDICIYFGVIAWGAWWLSWVVFGSICYLIIGIEPSFWLSFWRFWLTTLFVGAAITTVWFICGGLLDLKFLFNKLKTIKRSDLDDGTVVGNQNLEEAKSVKSVLSVDDKVSNN